MIIVMQTYKNLWFRKQKKTINFSLNGGHATGTYQFQTGFYGLMDVPAELQKVIDLILTNGENMTTC